MMFTTYEFKGLHVTKSTGKTKKLMSIKECFDKVFNTYYDSDTKRFFNCYNFIFTSKAQSLKSLEWLIQKGYVIFPISEKCRRKDVEEFINAGFKPLFMKAAEYNSFRKEYEKYL